MFNQSGGRLGEPMPIGAMRLGVIRAATTNNGPIRSLRYTLPKSGFAPPSPALHVCLSVAFIGAKSTLTARSSAYRIADANGTAG
jgi:hypothetical protein